MTDLLNRITAALADRYAVERQIGMGGMATVFLAEDLKHGRKVAVKVLKPELAAALGGDRFSREIQIAARLQHPHILPLLDSGEAGGFLYYVMPFVEGQSLRERLTRTGELPVHDAVKILVEVVDALTHAHAHGVVHRDIKPDNVMLSGRHALVTDFGVAKAVSEATGRQQMTTAGVAMGTPAYMAPEQAAADPNLDHRVDIYAVGCVAYELLTGRPPFDRLSPQETLAAHVTQAPDPVERHRNAVPAALAAVIMKCLAKRPADRWQTAEELLHQLEPLATPSGGTTPTQTRPVDAVVLVIPWWRRRAMVAAVTVLAAAGGTVLAAEFWPRRGPALAPERVAVDALVNATGDAALEPVGRMAADWIIRGLSETGLMDVTGAGSGGGRTSSAGAEAAGADLGRVRVIAEASGAGTVVTGTYYRQGDSLQFVAQISDAAGRRVVRSLGPVAAAVRAPVDGIERLRQQVMGALAALFDPRLGEAAGTASQPPNYGAYREYIAGDEAFAAGQYLEAARHFSRAAALDSLYLMPRIREAYSYENVDRCAEVDSIGRQLNAVRVRLTQYEAHYLDRVTARCRGNMMAQYQAAAAMARLAPRSHFARYVAGRSAIPVNRAREAVQILEGVEPRRATTAAWQVYRDLADAYHLLGEYRRELDVVARARSNKAEHAALLVVEARAQAAMGKLDAVDELIAGGLRLPGATAANLIRVGASELSAHGHAEAARAVAGRGLAWLDSRPPDQRRTPGLRTLRSLALLLLDRGDEAEAIDDSLVPQDTIPTASQSTRSTTIAGLGLRGAHAARRGDRVLARRISDELAAVKAPYLTGSHTMARAIIAAQLGEREQAVFLISEAIGEGQGYLGLHSLFWLAPLRDFPPFQELLRPKG